MKSRAIPVLIAVLVLLPFTAALAQFTDDEVGRRPFWEKFLTEAKMVRAETLTEGVTKPKKLWLKKGDLEACAVWKRPAEAGAEHFDSWEHEVAAYRLDKLLGLNMVPPTIERSYHGYAGSLQLWVELAYNGLQIQKDGIGIPASTQEAYEKARSLQRAFDSLIANADRTLQNLRYTGDWRMILIDHSQTFRDTPPYVGRLLFGRSGDSSLQAFNRLPRAFLAKVRALTHEKIRAVVEDYLTSSEIDAVLNRRDLLLHEVEALVKEIGEGRVLY